MNEESNRYRGIIIGVAISCTHLVNVGENKLAIEVLRNAGILTFHKLLEAEIDFYDQDRLQTLFDNSGELKE